MSVTRRNRRTPLPAVAPAAMAGRPAALNVSALRSLISRALREDIGAGDITSRALIAPSCPASAVVVARQAGVLSGGPIAAQVFRELDRSIQVRLLKADGQPFRKNDLLLRIRGRARTILAGERTALNFLQRLTGIATLTARFIEMVRPYGTRILDTRKTTPGLRALEKYAVRCGGGTNHRMGLYDQVLIKDNHRQLLRQHELAAAVRCARDRNPRKVIEVEVENEDQLRRVLPARPDWILLDNMTPRQLKRCVRLCRGRARLEASGGITLKNIKAVAATGVQAISLGCLTHSAPAANLALEILDRSVSTLARRRRA